MKGLLSTGASRAWVGVALAGLVIIALVFGLALIPRLGAGQRVIDAATPAFADTRIEGTQAGLNTISQYVDVVDPLLTRRGGGLRDAEALIVLMRRKLGVSTEQVRKILRREAPRTEALTRALPLAAIADEVTPLTVVPRDDPRHDRGGGRRAARARLPAHLPVADGAAQHRRRLVRRARHRRADAAERRQAGAHRARPAQVLPRRPRAAAGEGQAGVPQPRRLRRRRLHPVPAAGARRRRVRDGRAAGPAREEDHARQALVEPRRRHRGVHRRARPRRAVLPALQRRAADHDRLQARLHAGARARGGQRRRLAARGDRVRRRRS